MIRVPAGIFALVLFAIPFVAAPIKPIGTLGGLGLLVAAVGIGGLWRWLVTVAACVFLIEYTAALWVARASLSVGGAVAFGLALLFLVESIELGRGFRRATVAGRVVRSQVSAALGFATATVALTLLGLVLAGGFVASIPFAAAPFVAALAALGVVLALAAILREQARR
jgi:hypothetical protein